MSAMRLVVARVMLPAYSTFPFDMLRHDCCWPENEPDSGKLGIVNEYPRNIIVKRWTDKPQRDKRDARVGWEENWTVARWESFGVKLVQVSS